MTRLPSSLVIAFWVVGALWLVALGYSYTDLPPAVLGGAFVMAMIAALMEWLTGGEPPQ